jgi:TPR repeat protein
VQCCVFAWWGWHARNVYEQIPLIVAQVVFLYAFSALLSWSRGRPWRLGFGPLPIIFSTNLLLWFKPEWYFLQFAMVATGALGKEFIRWRRDGQDVHVFNPSVFGQVVFAIALLATGTTRDLTLGTQIAASFEAVPDMYLLLFALGLAVQFRFAVTLMTLAAAATLGALNVAYTEWTGTYFFLSVNIGATVFLGLHLLITDPSTSPRTNLGRIAFGAMYGAGYFITYRLLEDHGAPLFWDKLLPVPILNLCVPLLDRMARLGIGGWLERGWQGSLRPSRLNLVHMAIWASLFITMLATGFVAARHPGESLAFWQQAYEDDRPRAGKSLLRLATHRAAHDDAEACDALGMIQLEGKLVPQDAVSALRNFEKACVLGNYAGCKHVVMQYLVRGEVNSPAILKLALDRVEETCAAGGADGASYLILGQAFETGRGRPRDPDRARELYEEACRVGSRNACAAIERLATRAQGSSGASHENDRPAVKDVDSVSPPAGSSRRGD